MLQYLGDYISVWTGHGANVSSIIYRFLKMMLLTEQGPGKFVTISGRLDICLDSKEFAYFGTKIEITATF